MNIKALDYQALSEINRQTSEHCPFNAGEKVRCADAPAQNGMVFTVYRAEWNYPYGAWMVFCNAPSGDSVRFLGHELEWVD